jgi:hypothetical protein
MVVSMINKFWNGQGGSSNFLGDVLRSFAEKFGMGRWLEPHFLACITTSTLTSGRRTSLSLQIEDKNSP